MKIMIIIFRLNYCMSSAYHKYYYRSRSIMKRRIYSLIGLFLAATFSVNAAMVNVQSVNIANNFSNNDLATYWSSITPTTSENITDLSGLFSGSGNNNTMYKLTATFDSANGLEVDFSAGLDAGYGAEVFVNSVNQFDTTSNLWWANNWNSSAVININDIIFGAGPNTIEVYWAENTNSGGNSFIITETPLEAVDASAPAMFALFGLGLAGLAFRRKK